MNQTARIFGKKQMEQEEDWECRDYSLKDLTALTILPK